VSTRQLVLSRYELSVHSNHRKSVVVAFCHDKSINLLFIINERFRWWTKREEEGKEAQKRSPSRHSSGSRLEFDLSWPPRLVEPRLEGAVESVESNIVQFLT